MATDASPTPQKQGSIGFHSSNMTSRSNVTKHSQSANIDAPLPLTTSKLGNQQHSRAAGRRLVKPKVDPSVTCKEAPTNAGIDSLLSLDSGKPIQTLTRTSNIKHTFEKVPVKATRDGDTSSNGSLPITPASDRHIETPASKVMRGTPGSGDSAEVVHLRQKLAVAQQRIAHMDQELQQKRIEDHTIDQIINTPSENEPLYKEDVSEKTISDLQNALNAKMRPLNNRSERWMLHEDDRVDGNNPLRGGTLNRVQGIWGDNVRPNLLIPTLQVMEPTIEQPVPTSVQNLNNHGLQSWSNGSFNPTSHSNQNLANSVSHVTRTSPVHRIDPYQSQTQPANDLGHLQLETQYRRSVANPPNRCASTFGRFNGWTPCTNSMTKIDGNLIPQSLTPIPVQSTWPNANQMSDQVTYQPTPVGTRLSPTAAEFSVDSMSMTPWNNQASSEPQVTYVAPSEPINYRRMLDKNATGNWPYIVGKIVTNNDQQASIFLQQKLKVSTNEQKFDIVEAIIAQAYPLMINRFGNFLVQRCFEHGTPEQVIAIANAIRGKVLTLSTDAFGCHVVQKAFDAVPEQYKATMVHELLRRIPDTVIHRYACHVWQKLFELRWNDSPPQIMKYVNEALCGMWHEVALGETGSLVVQNIFENCLEEDKRPCINEVLASIDVIAHGQFGNWCIQHICEHGAPADRSRAIDHILRFATEYSMDQYASKVIEKCLKIGGPEFMDRYLERVCEGRPDRPRMPLIDIAGDQFGNYLVQYILTHANPQYREIVATHVRKHMVSLRGSKYGSRVAMLCCNPAVATRPGPPATIPTPRFTNNTTRGTYSAFR